MANSKTPHNSTECDTTQKSLYWDDEINMLTFQPFPVREQWIEKLARELVDWAVNDKKALKLNQFYSKRGITQQTMNKWRHKSKVLDDACEFAKHAIGDRRETAALYHKMDKSIVGITMPHYDKDWKDLAEWKVKMKAESEAPMLAAKVVILERYPESDTVPMRKIEGRE